MLGLRIWQGYDGMVMNMQGLQRVLSMPEYASIMLNMIEYASTYLKKKKQSAEYTRILNMSDAVHRIGWVTVQITKHFLRQGHIQDTVKHLRLSILQK